ncbi:DsbA family protein [Grimontia kaedaensis]|uniref:DsbA family protein n=1 Tax=Grimontia kaedaensis TaxID=2872157 RepID=A0ABY4WWG4_9GAMM|nr:DsbA family protein [Grimontia kaedaensis]USH03141.1 DsbA family protein [Grimontia kaedaensis]
MKNKMTSLLALIFLALSAQAFAEKNTLTTEQENKLSDIVTMLENHPALIPGLHQSLSAYLSQQQQFDAVLKENHAYLYDNPAHPQFGGKDAELVIINFTDYSCPFCKKLDPVLHEVAKNNPPVRVVNILVPLKEMHGLLPDVNSATLAINVWNHDRDNYLDVHQLLLKKPSAHDLRSVKRVAKETGTDRFAENDAQTGEMLEKNYQLFSQLGLRGTPAMIIGDQVVPGYLPEDKLQAIIDQHLEN